MTELIGLKKMWEKQLVKDKNGHAPSSPMLNGTVLKEMIDIL